MLKAFADTEAFKTTMKPPLQWSVVRDFGVSSPMVRSYHCIIMHWQHTVPH